MRVEEGLVSTLSFSDKMILSPEMICFLAKITGKTVFGKKESLATT